MGHAIRAYNAGVYKAEHKAFIRLLSKICRAISISNLSKNLQRGGTLVKHIMLDIVIENRIGVENDEHKTFILSKICIDGKR